MNTLTPADAQRVEQARLLLVSFGLLAYLAAKALGVVGRFADQKVAPAMVNFSTAVAEAGPPRPAAPRTAPSRGLTPP